MTAAEQSDHQLSNLVRVYHVTIELHGDCITRHGIFGSGSLLPETFINNLFCVLLVQNK